MKLLSVPYKYLYPSAILFICVGVYAARHSMFDVGTTLFIGLFGYLLLKLRFEPAPILLGFVLGQHLEENFRRALVLSRGDLMVFVERPLSGFFLLLSVLLVGTQVFFWLRRSKSTLRLAKA